MTRGYRKISGNGTLTIGEREFNIMKSHRTKNLETAGGFDYEYFNKPPKQDINETGLELSVAYPITEDFEIRYHTHPISKHRSTLMEINQDINTQISTFMHENWAIMSKFVEQYEKAIKYIKNGQIEKFNKKTEHIDKKLTDLYDQGKFYGTTEFVILSDGRIIELSIVPENLLPTTTVQDKRDALEDENDNNWKLAKEKMSENDRRKWEKYSAELDAYDDRTEEIIKRKDMTIEKLMSLEKNQPVRPELSKDAELLLKKALAKQDAIIKQHNYYTGVRTVDHGKNPTKDVRVLTRLRHTPHLHKNSKEYKKK